MNGRVKSCRHSVPYVRNRLLHSPADDAIKPYATAAWLPIDFANYVMEN